MRTWGHEANTWPRPRLTGWAQVKNGYRSEDFYYLQNQSPVLDRRIVTRTFRSILYGTGR
jgi:lipopolysaccharide/colanic/teichoic acid biosynthesis glycosyltransferase